MIFMSLMILALRGQDDVKTPEKPKETPPPTEPPKSDKLISDEQVK